jgi:hypothetical protein
VGLEMNEQADGQEVQGWIERERVVALVDLYVTTLDEPSTFDGDWARSLFTKDVRFEHEIAVLHGIEEVAAAHDMVMARWERTLHFTANHRVEIDGERAHLMARLMAIHIYPGENPPEPLITANLLDADAVRTNNGWRFERFAPRNIWRSERTTADPEANKE